MKKRVLALVLALVMAFSLVPLAFAAPATNVLVGAGIEAVSGDDAFDGKGVGIIGDDNKLETEKVAFQVNLSTAEIRKSIIDWHNYGEELIAGFFDPTDPVEKPEYDKLIADFNERSVSGEFTVVVNVSDEKLEIPEEYTADTKSMAGFNAEANIVFDEVSRTYEDGVLTIDLKITDNMSAGELLEIAKLEKEGLGELIFTAEDIDASGIDNGTCYVDGHLRGATLFQTNSHRYPVNFITNTVRAYVSKYVTHGIEGDVYIKGLEDGDTVRATLINYTSGGSKISLSAARLSDEDDGGYIKFNYALDESNGVKDGKYNVVIEVVDEDGKILGTVTKLISIYGDDDAHVSDAYINIEREEPDKPTYHPHDKFEPKNDKETDKDKDPVSGGESGKATPPVAGESDSANHNHEADEAKEELKHDYEEESKKDDSENKYVKAQEEVKEEAERNSGVAKDKQSVKEEFHSERWLEGRYKNNYVKEFKDEDSGEVVIPEDVSNEVKEVAGEQKEIYDAIKADENIMEPEDAEGDEIIVDPTTVYFEFTAWALDRIEYIVTDTDTGTVIETITKFLDEEKQFIEESESTRQLEETSLVYEVIISLDELADTEKEFYQLYATEGKNIFVHRRHGGVVETFKLLKDTDRKDIDRTYYIDKATNTLHIFTRKFSLYSLTVADGEPPVYGEGDSTGSVISDVTKKVTLIIDGVETEVIKVSAGDTVKLSDLPVPTKEGYTFNGWYTDSALTEKLEGDIKVNKNVTLYAHWINNTLDNDNHFAYILGYVDETIRPENNITRAEVATIFYRLLRDDVRAKIETDENSFADVNPNGWYNTAISTMANGGYVLGRDATTFDPEANITRAEFATMATRFAVLEATGNVSFNDIDGHWAKNYILKAATAGWIYGDGDGTFRPEDPITRAEVMAIINRILVRKVDEKGIHNDAKIWTDVSTKKWYYEDVIEATNSHNFTRNSDGITETWTEITPNKEW